MTTKQLDASPLNIPTSTPQADRLSIGWKSAYALLVAMVLVVPLGIGFFAYGGIFGPLSDAGSLLVGVCLVPLVWVLSGLNDGRRFNPIVSALGVVAATGIGIGSVGLILRYLLPVVPESVGSAFLGVQFLGWLLLGVWLLGIGALGLQSGAVETRVSWTAIVSGIGAAGGIVTLVYSYAVGSFTLAFPVFMLVYVVGFLLWAYWLGGDLRKMVAVSAGQDMELTPS